MIDFDFAAEVYFKWKKYRETVYRSFTVGAPDEKEYIERMKTYQLLIKAKMSRDAQKVIPAVIDICHDVQLSGMTQLHVISAGFDLLNDKDYTI